MTIIELLKSEDYDARIDCGNKWLIVNEQGEFTVYERKYGQKKTRTITETTSEAAAVASLTEDNAI